MWGRSGCVRKDAAWRRESNDEQASHRTSCRDTLWPSVLPSEGRSWLHQIELGWGWGVKSVTVTHTVTGPPQSVKHSHSPLRSQPPCPCTRILLPTRPPLTRYDTGDSGYVGADGYVHVMARTDDVLNVAGHRLASGALEEVRRLRAPKHCAPAIFTAQSRHARAAQTQCLATLAGRRCFGASPSRPASPAHPRPTHPGL